MDILSTLGQINLELICAELGLNDLKALNCVSRQITHALAHSGIWELYDDFPEPLDQTGNPWKRSLLTRSGAEATFWNVGTDPDFPALTLLLALQSLEHRRSLAAPLPAFPPQILHRREIGFLLALAYLQLPTRCNADPNLPLVQRARATPVLSLALRNEISTAYMTWDSPLRRFAAAILALIALPTAGLGPVAFTALPLWPPSPFHIPDNWQQVAQGERVTAFVEGKPFLELGTVTNSDEDPSNYVVTFTTAVGAPFAHRLDRRHIAPVPSAALLHAWHEGTLQSLRYVAEALLGDWKGVYLYPDGRADPPTLLTITTAELAPGQAWSSPTDLVGYSEGHGAQPCVTFGGQGEDTVGRFRFEGTVFRSRLIEARKSYVTEDTVTLVWAYHGTWTGLGMFGHWSRTGDYTYWSGTWMLCKNTSPVESERAAE